MHFNWVQIFKTSLLCLLIAIVLYIISADFIMGPQAKQHYEEHEIREKIAKHQTCKDIYRTNFKYETYTCVTNKEYIVYDVHGKDKARRDIDSQKLVKVQQLIDTKYPLYTGAQIKVGYGKKAMAFIVEKKGNILVIDFDTLKVIFNSEEM